MICAWVWEQPRTSTVGQNAEVPRPIPTNVYHMTRLEHVESIALTGLLADARAQPFMAVEIGNHEIKEARRTRVVEAGPGGVVADYAPFYFSPLSPMQFSIYRGNVPTYSGGTRELVFLRSTTQRLRGLGLGVVTSDRNARQALARFTDDDDLEDFIDWQIISAQYWNDYIEGKERRQAECLVHQQVPWAAIQEVGVYDRAIAGQVVGRLAAAGVDTGVVSVRREWYF